MFPFVPDLCLNQTSNQTLLKGSLLRLRTLCADFQGGESWLAGAGKGEEGQSFSSPLRTVLLTILGATLLHPGTG